MASLALSVSFTLQAQTASFTPDVTFKGSTLSGWHRIGKGKWSASNGVISGSGEGWLILDHSYQDAGLYTQFRRDGACDTGVLLRAHKTDKGTSGVFVSIKGDALQAWALDLDTGGKEISRTSHLDDFYDPDPYGPAVLYWYRTVRDKNAPGGAKLVPELINNRSADDSQRHGGRPERRRNHGRCNLHPQWNLHLLGQTRIGKGQTVVSLLHYCRVRVPLCPNARHSCGINKFFTACPVCGG